jgi:hypothetical protein
MCRAEFHFPTASLRSLETTKELSMHSHFRVIVNRFSYFSKNLANVVLFKIAKNLTNFMITDYRLRIQIRKSLEQCYFRNQKQSFASNIAFQVAFSYQIGFGVESDDSQRQTWLQRSSRQRGDLEAEKVAIKTNWNMCLSIRNFQGHPYPLDLIHEYRTWDLKKLGEARKEYEREVGSMVREFEELHFIPLTLYGTIGDLLDELREFRESKAQRMRIRDQIKNTDGIGHPYYIQSIINVARSHSILGEWVEAQVLRKEVLKHMNHTCGPQSLEVTTTAINLASTYRERKPRC